MSRDALMFLASEKARLVELWADVVTSGVNPRLLADPEFFSRQDLDGLYDSILDAFRRNQYRDLNQTFDRLVEEGYGLGLTYTDIKGLLFGMPEAAQRLADEEYAGRASYNLLSSGLRECRLSLKSVYCKRGSAAALRVLEDERRSLVARWEADLPTDVVSPHFGVISESEQQRLVEGTFEMYLKVLLGEDEEMVPDPRDAAQENTRLGAYLVRMVDFFQQRGFDLADVLKALSHIARLAEPLFFREYREDPVRYRQAVQALSEARDIVAVSFAGNYNDKLMRDYYNEVSIMLHRIKNKLTAVPTSLQTILPQEYDGVYMDGDTLTAQDAEYLVTYERLRTECLKSTLDFLQRFDESGGEGGRPARAAREGRRLPSPEEVRAELDALAGKYRLLRQFVAENQSQVANIKRKLDTEAVLRVDEFLHDALEGGELTTQLTKELQEVQNELYNREKPVWEEMDLREPLREAFEESKVDAKGKRITYTLDMPPEPVPIFAVRRQIKRPLAQVINNALKYTPDGGEVHVKLERDGGNATIVVKDTGIGIPIGEEDQVFALCARCSNAQEFNRDGSGTGLYNDRKTVRLHNGDMWVKSDGVGKGSVFYIQLPIHEAAAVTS